MKKSRKKVIIVTGPSGAGKSLLCEALAEKGWRHLDADKIAQGLYARGKPAYQALIREFGPGILGRGGHVARPRLGKIVFSDPKALRRLDALLTPPLIRELRARLKSPRRSCVDMATYFKAGAPDFGGLVVLVQAPLKLRVKRLVARGLKSPAAARAQAQALRFGPPEKRRADLVLVNASVPDAMKRKLLAWLDGDA